MSLSPDLAALGDERFVSLATFRRTGEAVATPVWVARDGDALVVITPAGTGKTKRLRRDDRVTLTPCDRRGSVADGAPTVEAVARIDDDPAAVARVKQAVAAKYGWEFRAFMAIEAIVARGRRERVAIVITSA